jgi:trehalose-6-phosphatase
MDLRGFYRRKGLYPCPAFQVGQRAGCQSSYPSGARGRSKKMKTLDLLLFEGPRFLEVAPAGTSKAEAVDLVLKTYPWEKAGVAMFRDDDKDEIAFELISMLGGISVRVSDEPVQSHAVFRLVSPSQVRKLLEELALDVEESCTA